MRQQPVVTHPDTKHAADVVENESGEHRARIDVEEGRHGADVEPGHGDCSNPVQSGLMFAAVQEHRGRHWRGYPPKEFSEKESPHHSSPAAAAL
jgi:hypothetical protein